MVDTQKLRKAVENFKFYSPPSSGCSSNPATVGDVRNVIDKTAKLFEELIIEIENQEQ